MKFFKFKILTALIASGVVLGTSCEKVDFGNINNNPNQTTEPITSALLTGALVNLGTNTVWDAGGVRTIAGLYGQYYTETQYTETSRYARTTANWDGFYSGVLYDLQNIINYNSDPATAQRAQAYGSNANQIAVARILKAYYFWWLTDIWGDIPYFEALKGKGTIPYDKQELIYKDLLKELTEAVDQFDNGLAARGDIMYNGDISKWKKFANSLRMLISLRMSKADPTLGKTEFAAALAHPAGSISTNADNATIVFPGGNYRNPVNNYYNVTQRDDYGVAQAIVDWMKNRGDRRLNAIASSDIGFPYGLTRENAVSFANANTNFARPLKGKATPESEPMVVVGAAHVLLARAEAAFLGWTSENYTTLYYQGIEQSWRQWGVYDATAFANYIANADVNLAGGDVYKKIATQRWLAWYPNGIQGWAVWRKTGFPLLTPAPGQAAIPRRLSYGTNEPQLNPDNYAPAAAQYNNDSQFARLWWDKP